MNRRNVLKWLFGSSAVLTGSSLGWALASTLDFQVNRHEVKLEGLRRPLRLAHLTDLHIGKHVRLEQIRTWVEATNREQPDVVCITGDIVDHALPLERLDELALELGRLRAPLGVFACLGNHDYWYVTRDDSVWGLVRRLESAGVRVLVNAGVRLRDDFWLGGLDDLWRGEPDVEKTLQNIPDSRLATVLMSHNPDVLVRPLPGVNLVISGHTHGGQVRIPGLPTIYNVSNYGERFQRGFVQGTTRGFVSKGLGVGGTLPLRVFAKAELVLLELQPG
jgi:uncharacterized protein